MNFLDRRSIVLFLISQPLLFCSANQCFIATRILLAIDILLLWSGYKSWDSFHTLLSKSHPTCIMECAAHRHLSYSTQIISENSFQLGALYPENNQQKSAVIGGSNPQNPHTGHALPLLQFSGGFHYLDVWFLLHSEFSRPS